MFLLCASCTAASVRRIRRGDGPHLGMSPEQWRVRSQPAASVRRHWSATTLQRLHADIVGDQNAVITIMIADHSCIG